MAKRTRSDPTGDRPKSPNKRGFENDDVPIRGHDDGVNQEPIRHDWGWLNAIAGQMSDDFLPDGHEPLPMPTKRGGTPFHALRVDHVQVNVTDLDRARRFYAGDLGLEEVPRPESFDFAGAWYRIGEVDLHLVVRAAEPRSARHFCLWVADVRAAGAHLARLGHEVLWEARNPIPGVERFFTFDPDGNRIEVQGSDGTGRSRWEQG